MEDERDRETAREKERGLEWRCKHDQSAPN